MLAKVIVEIANALRSYHRMERTPFQLLALLFFLELSYSFLSIKFLAHVSVSNQLLRYLICHQQRLLAELGLEAWLLTILLRLSLPCLQEYVLLMNAECTVQPIARVCEFILVENMAFFFHFVEQRC